MEPNRLERRVGADKVRHVDSVHGAVVRVAVYPGLAEVDGLRPFGRHVLVQRQPPVPPQPDAACRRVLGPPHLQRAASIESVGAAEREVGPHVHAKLVHVPHW